VDDGGHSRLRQRGAEQEEKAGKEEVRRRPAKTREAIGESGGWRGRGKEEKAQMKTKIVAAATVLRELSTGGAWKEDERDNMLCPPNTIV
jgi:hypothetical protein